MDNQNNSSLPNPNPNPNPVLTPEPGSTWPPSPPPQPQNTWAPPIQPEPVNPVQDSKWPPITSDPIPTWTPPVQAETPIPAPMPTFAPPSSIPTPLANTPETNTSNLDNPWGTPIQPPVTTNPPAPTEPSWMNTAPAESVPTDLSHLISDNNNAAPVETLVVPSVSASNPEVSNLSAETHKGIPKWVFGLGIGLLILVIGASAYFILGIGQPAKTTSSIPAVVQTPTPTAVPTSQPTVAPVATGSANFEGLQGSGSAPQATSAAEILRQRQQGR